MNAADLVITAALPQELPVAWLREQGVAVHRLTALRSGALKRASGPNAGVSVVLTGVGPGAAGEAARWIRDHVAPRFVVNMGTAGALHGGGRPRGWVTPAGVESEAGEPLAIDTRLPFALPQAQNRHLGGTLLSVREARPGAPLPRWRTRDYVDMECHAQAAVFADTDTAFHVLKWKSDAPGAGAEEAFAAALPELRGAARQVLGFLARRERPEIAVVVPVHNRAERIEATLQTVLEQTLPATEVIVVDDGSGDGTGAVLDRHSGRVRVVTLPENLGVSAARNAGVAATRCGWIAFLDSDDHWTPDKLARQWAFHERNPHYDALQCEEIWIRNGVRVNPHNHHAKPAGWIWEPSLRRCLVSPSGVLMRRTLFRQLGGFDDTLPACEDYDLWIRLARHHVVGLAPHVGVIKHGGHDDQLSRRYRAMDRFRVAALRKALQVETEPRYQERLAAILREKLDILIQGARKRTLTEEVRHYQRLREALPDSRETSPISRQ